MSRTESKLVPGTRPHRWKRHAILLVTGLVVVVGCFFARRYLGDSQVGADTRNFFGFANSPVAKNEVTSEEIESSPTVKGASRPEHPQHDVMAIVNGEDIKRAQLAQACVERHGEEVLESLVNKRLILHHCRNRNIEVTQDEISAEIDHMAKRFKLGREQWLDLLERERGIGREEYVRDILWPTLALRKLAADQLTVSEEELDKAYETQFGPAVHARLLVVSSRAQAEEVHAQLVQRPEEFARLAMKHSEDINSASIGGLIQPIRRHVGDASLEQAVFSLEPGQISQILPVAEKFAILKCESHIPPQEVSLNEVRAEITEQIKETKLREVASQLFEDLQNSAVIQNVLNDPDLSQQMPGIVSTVNGDQITMSQLGDECLLRYGKDVLELEISQVLLQQSLADSQQTVTQEDVDREVRHAAILAGVVDKQGQPDFEAWFQLVTEEQGVSQEIYVRDSVWPSAALKKLTGDSIQVREQDLQKGFDANYGQRVRCRAIVLHNMRKAMEVWGKARQNPSMEYFGELATEYSIEPTSKSLHGEVPPIRRHGGQPQLEEVAFALQENELSEVIQVGNRFIILKCEGRTKPIDIRREDVEEILRLDITEKKLRLAMAEKFEQIRSVAQIDNYLAGTSQAGTRGSEASTAAKRYDSAVRPASGSAVQ